MPSAWLPPGGTKREEQTALYRLVQQHAASFIARPEVSTGNELPRFIKAEPGH